MTFVQGAVDSLCAALLTVGLIPLVIPWSRRLGLVDLPGGRKLHSGAVPLVGGLAIYAAILIVAVNDPAADRHTAMFLALAGAALAAGVADDRYRLPAWTKLLIQFAIAIVAVNGAGSVIGGAAILLHLGVMPGAIAAPLSILLYVALMNAINLSDGADGVAGGIALVMFAGFLAFAACRGIAADPVLWIALGAVGGFLVYNAPRVRRRSVIFLGDAGSMVIGFSLAWFAIGLHQRAPTVSPMPLVWALAVPVIDMGCVALGRLSRGVSPFTAGRDHLHHLLLDHGAGPAATALVIALLTALFAAIGGAGALLFRLPDATLCGLLIAAVLVYGSVTGTLRRLPARRPPAVATAWRAPPAAQR